MRKPHAFITVATSRHEILLNKLVCNVVRMREYLELLISITFDNEIRRVAEPAQQYINVNSLKMSPYQCRHLVHNLQCTLTSIF